MFKRHYEKRSTSIPFVIFRMILSMVMLMVLVVGIYSAYKHFSGLDPLKLDPQAVISELLAGNIPQQFLGLLSSNKITKNLSEGISQKVSGQQSSKQIISEEPGKKPIFDPIFQFLLVSDSHNNNEGLDKAISSAKAKFPDLKFIIGLGDYTEVGTIKELDNAKEIFDKAAVRYFLIPGDHDLWDCRNRSLPAVSCFEEVFGPPYQSFEFNDFEFLLLDNSDNYIGFDSKQLLWIADKLENLKQNKKKGILVFMHESLYHPSSEHIMGWVEKSLKIQAEMMLFKLKEVGVKNIFSGDIHYFSEYKEPKTSITMNTIGAVTLERNPQTPRYAVVSVFDNGVIKIEDIEIR